MSKLQSDILYEVHQEEDFTVSDLIILLQELPPDQVVCTRKVEGGYEPIRKIEQQILLKDVNDEWYLGKHDTLDSVSDPYAYESETFIILK